MIAKAKKRSDVKWCHLNARIKAAGEVGAPLHLKTKAYHMTWEVALSAGFPMEDLANILMLRRWYFDAAPTSLPSTHRGPDQLPMFSKRSPRRPHSSKISYSTGGMIESTGSRMHWSVPLAEVPDNMG